MSRASDTARFREAARQSLGQLLLRAARLLDERALERVALAGLPIRPAHSRLFPHLSMDGIRSTELADRLGVTKQAVAPLIADLVGWGLVEMVPDPADGRARLVRWTDAGVQGLLVGLGVLSQFEAELAERVGLERVETTREVLAELLELLEAPSK